MDRGLELRRASAGRPDRADRVGRLRLWAAAIMLALFQWALPSSAHAEATVQPNDTPRVLLFPAQPVFRAVTQANAAKITDLLAKELARAGTCSVLRAGEQASPSSLSNEEGSSALENTATSAETTHDIEAAIASRRKLLALLSTQAQTPEDAGRYVLAYHLLARDLMWSGHDDEAKKTMLEAARLQPSFEFPKGQFSRLYQRWFASAAKEVMEGPKGDLLVRSVLPGTAISLDGRPMDVAPVRLKGAPAGRHLIVAQTEGVRPSSAVVEVPAKGQAEFTVTFGETLGGSPVGTVSDLVAENKVSADTVSAATAAGKNASAAFVVLNGLSRDEEHILVHTFVVGVKDGTIAGTDVVSFDLDLLTAESDVLRVVQHINEKLKNWAGGKATLGSIEPRAQSVNIINEVNVLARLYDQSSSPGEKGREAGQRRAVLKPLQGGSIRIKDD